MKRDEIMHINVFNGDDGIQYIRYSDMEKMLKRIKEVNDKIENDFKIEMKRLNNIINEFDYWLDINLINLEKENVNSTYDKGLKQGMIANGRLIKNKLQELKRK